MLTTIINTTRQRMHLARITLLQLCFRKPKWSRVDPVETIQVNDEKINQMAEGDELLRRVDIILKT